MAEGLRGSRAKTIPSIMYLAASLAIAYNSAQRYTNPSSGNHMTEWSGESWQSCIHVLKFNKPTCNFASHFFTYIFVWQKPAWPRKNYQPQISLKHLDSLLSSLQNHYMQKSASCKESRVKILLSTFRQCSSSLMLHTQVHISPPTQTLSPSFLARSLRI